MITLNDSKALLVGFSGGADSCALLIYLNENEELTHIQKHVIYCHHHLRKEADDELLFCKEFATKLGYTFHEAHLDIPHDKNLETRARKARYEAYEKCMDLITHNQRQKGILALGHHIDDQLETFFTRMTRGSNLSGLIAPRKWSQSINGITIYRPLLHFKKIDLINILHTHGINHWMEDHTNAENFCLRNQIRNEMITPLKTSYPHAYAGMLATLQTLNMDCHYLETTALNVFHKLAKNHTHLDRIGFAQEHVAIQIRVLRYFLEENGVQIIPNKSLLERVISLANADIQEPLKAPLGSNYQLVANHKYFVVRSTCQCKID